MNVCFCFMLCMFPLTVNSDRLGTTCQDAFASVGGVLVIKLTCASSSAVVLEF